MTDVFQIACRCETDLDPPVVDKIAQFCQVEREQVVVVRDMPTVYQVPYLLEKQGLIPVLRNILDLEHFTVTPELREKGSRIWQQWKSLTVNNPQLYDPEPVSIALVGKYIELHDSYLSVIKSLEHSAMRCRRKLKILWVDAEHLENHVKISDPAKHYNAWVDVTKANGILVPGGFGLRGTEGMVEAAKWAREHKKPYLGICLGMQIAVIEFARNICGISGATSGEFNDNAKDKVIMFMPEGSTTAMGGTMRLGNRPTLFQPGSEWSRLRALYAEKEIIRERHRHRYEVNPDYIDRLEAKGLSFIGKDDAGVRMEVIEFKDHPWFVGVQYHPEYLSRVLHPSKPYLGLVAASAGCLEQITQELNSPTPPVVNGVNGYHGGGIF